MKTKFLAMLLTFCMCAGVAFATEEESASAEKKKPVPKPDSGSAIVSILQLPIVQGWQQSIAAQGESVSLSVWGESIKEVNGQECWGVGVGKNNGEDTRLWKRFCVARNGSEIWVEHTPSKDDSTDQVTYFTYDEWVSKCHPTSDSLGSC